MTSGPQFRRPGFTLLEILIVVACIAIVALLVVPSGDNTQTRLEMAARLLVADLEFAQLESIGNGADPCLIVFNKVDNSYEIVRHSSPSVPITNPATSGPYITHFGRGREEFLNGVTIDDISVGGDDRLEFTAMGALDQGTDAVITLRCGAQSTRIRLDASTGEPALD